MKIHQLTTVTGILFALVSATVLAGPGHHGNGKGKFMQYFDTNQDDIVTLDEFNAASTKRFDKMDANADGVIKKEEFRDYVSGRKQARRDERFQSADSNQDGQLSLDEFLNRKKQRAEQHFKTMDLNNDGVVTKEEFVSGKGHRDGAKNMHHDGGKMCDESKQGSHHDWKGHHEGMSDHHDGMQGHHGDKQGHHGGNGFFAKIDSNADGEVTREESQTAWLGWFKRIDANNDGTVTAEEVRNYRRNKMEPQQGMSDSD